MDEETKSEGGAPSQVTGPLAWIQQEREAAQEQLRLAILEAGSPAEWLQKTALHVAETSPQGLTEADLLWAPEGWYRDANDRLALCSICLEQPEGVAKCARVSDSRFNPGQVPEWAESPRRLGWRGCPRWREVRLRGRLGALGVPLRYVSATIGEIPEGPGRDPAVEAAVTFLGDAVGGGGPWLVVSGANAAESMDVDRYKTSLAVGVLRNMLKRVPRTLAWYVDVIAVQAEFKRRRDEQESIGDVLANAHQCDLLVIENVDPKTLQAWCNERIEGLLRERWLAQKATLVTTHATREQIAKSYETITGFAGVPTCSLL